ncbi:Inner centromere-like protein pic1 [Tolypocladium ophioglossoides CBS 100239]|uniref:Inner centromere-like protein pic1 n=1 Tax=Tolypocladium ophioglossoides (strain CBS 100239) TaxID=1163406 RepID=A0A0L0NFT4_TOLOC|nr:Inner centromere-like protein pic1 [Tolypocladium ophioglossoides CBS 100239]
MAAMRGPRLQVGSASWIAEERASALQIAQSEVEEFTFSVRNELDWLNEHMAGIFNENETNIAETFKTPGNLRGKTPRTARKANLLESRVPLSDVFAPTPNAPTNVASQLNRAQAPQIHDNAASKNAASKNAASPVKHASPRKAAFSPKQAAPASATQDSGYFGSQDVGSVNIHLDSDPVDTQATHNLVPRHTTTVPVRDTPSRAAAMESPEKTFQTAQEEQTTRVPADVTAKTGTPRVEAPKEQPEEDEHMDMVSASTPAAMHPVMDAAVTEQQSEDANTEQPLDDARSQSDGSSPIRPMVRKSSLNFASLPAREPLTAGKSIGARVSRTSHLDHIRTSYYNRPTGGKSLGNLAKLDYDEDENRDEMDVGEEPPAREPSEQSNIAASHTKTYTQRLQDQINMLRKSQANSSGQPKPASSMQAPQHKAIAPTSLSPMRKHMAQTTPGAFPEDDDDDWIEPPATVTQATEARPALPKSHSADVMEDIQGKDTIGQPDFRGRTFPTTHGHGKSASVSTVPIMHATTDPELQSLKKAVSVSNPSQLTVSEAGISDTPSKSPSRSFRESPLKQVKNKLSSILKSSRGLLASSAAISAEGKSMMSPSTTRFGLHPTASSESVVSKPRVEPQSSQTLAGQGDVSPTRPVARRTRASVEREKEEKRREKEVKRMEEQYEKLEKAREKERDKARIFSKEQEKMAAMEKQIASITNETPKPTRRSPRKVKAAEEGWQNPEDRDVEMDDAPPTVPPPSAPRSAGPGQATRNKETKRPVRPTKETQFKAKQAPTVIRVNTGSQHSQYHPSSRTSTASHDTAGPSSSQSQHQLVSKTSKASLHAKPSTQSLRNAASVGRSKALDLAAKKKEQDERDAQRRRDAKAEMERKRAAAQEEQRKQEHLRRQEVERQKQQEREHAASQNDGKTPAQRKAAIEKAKQTRAPPPATRSQPTGPPDFAQGKGMSTASSAKGDAQAARPQSRMTSNLHRSQDELSRPVNAVLSNVAKAGAKRALGTERSDDNQAKHPPSRGGPAYQANDAKRRRTSDAFDDESETENPRNIKGPPVRPSASFKKDAPTKSMYGYTNAPHSTTRDLFKATVTAQHNSQTKAAHPLDMAQISKGAIPFAPNPNPASASYRTPARPGAYNGAKSAAKSVPRSSPRFQNGESIELPEIQTDDEDEDEDETNGMVAAWADSPDLRRALMRQETMDPSQIFGPPAPLNMEEVFNKSKDRWHKFRARTSSANWSGADRLTEDDIRKDLAARDKLRREGGWSYEMSKDMI